LSKITPFHNFPPIHSGDHVVRVSRKIVEQIKEMNIYHPPKLLLNRQALLWSPRKKSSTASGAGGNFGNNYGNRRMTTE
jgi:hypothetical protein